jgi:hypothetical protein
MVKKKDADPGFPDGYHGPGPSTKHRGSRNLDPPASDDRPYPEDAPGPVSSPHTSWDARKDLE